MRRSSFILFVALLLASCSAEPDFEMTENSTPRLELNSKVLMEYDENLCQMAFNNSKCEFRLTTDNMTDYIIVDMETVPASAPSAIMVSSLQWSCKEGVVIRTNYKMDVVKIEGPKIWLWNSSDKLGLCLTTLQ